MTALTDQCNVIRSWLALGKEVYPDATVTSWIRMAEESLSKDLRCKEMVQIDTGLLADQRTLLPNDWRELDLVRLVGGKALRFTPRDDFYNPDFSADQKNCYTLSGNYIIVGGVDTTAGTQLEVTYYQDIPPLTGDPATWMLTKYPTLYTLKTLTIASMYSIEDDRRAMWNEEVTGLIASINLEHQLSKASGSRLTQRHRRGFG